MHSGYPVFFPANIKRPSSAEDERSWNTPEIPGPKMHNSSLRQPGYPEPIRTRGFASPDCSGFALSETYVYGWRHMSCRLWMTTHLLHKKALDLLPKMSASGVWPESRSQDA
jgi:hypothetical protein